MERYAISYVSSVSPLVQEADIEEILSYTKNRNNDNNITGILLYSEGNFFQVIEGQKSTIKTLYENISKDNRHRNLIKIFDKQINKNSFDCYETDFISERIKYSDVKLGTYLECLNSLDTSAQNVVKNILKVFLKQSNFT